MSLLRTKSIQVGSVIAFTGASPEEGSTFFYGTIAEFNLLPGDVVKVIDIDRSRDSSTPFARVTVAVLKGKFVGRLGTVSIDLSARVTRAWQALTMTGSMAPLRATRRQAAVPREDIATLDDPERHATSYSVATQKRNRHETPTRPAFVAVKPHRVA